MIAVALGMAALSAGGALSWIAKGSYHDFEQFYFAALAMHDGGELYSGRSGGYVYPPLTAYALMPLTACPLRAAATIWLGMNLAMGTAAAWLAAREAVRSAGLAASPWLTLGVAVVGTLVVADKIRSCLDQGQSDLVMVLAFVLGLRWLRSRAWAAGAALGLVANIKYATLAVLPYLVLRRRWRTAGWMVAWVIVFAMLPALHRGWGRNLDDLGAAVGALSRIADTDATHADLAPIARHRGVSVTSAVTRWLGRGAGGSGSGGGGGRSTLAVLCIVGIAGAEALIAAVLYRRRGIPLLRPLSDPSATCARRVTALEWSGLIVAVLAFSPHTEGRHMVLLLPVTCLAVALLVAERRAARRAPLAAGLILLWLGLTLPPGGERFHAMLDAWRAAAGASWCMLLMYLTLLWTGLPTMPVAAPPAARP